MSLRISGLHTLVRRSLGLDSRNEKEIAEEGSVSSNAHANENIQRLVLLSNSSQTIRTTLVPLFLLFGYYSTPL
jgi:hypothetical protein